MSDGVRVQILTRYKVVDEENWPAVWVDYPPQSGSDVTGVRPSGVSKGLVVECVYETAVLADILADPVYGESAVLWVDDGGDRGPDGVLGLAELVSLRAFLARGGWRAAEIDGAVGTVVNGRRRAVLVEGLIEWLRAVDSG